LNDTSTTVYSIVMKYFLAIVLLSFSFMSIAQSTGNPKPANTNSIEHPSSYFTNHPLLAKNPFFAEISKEPRNADAWLNLYKGITKMAMNKSNRRQLMLETTEAAHNYIHGSWQLSLIQFLQSGRRDSVSIHQALSTGQARKQLYPYAIQWALIAENKNLLKEYIRSLYQLEPLSALQYEYHYNAMMSAEKNATIYAKGITDLVPMLMLQQQLNIRPDLQFKFYDEQTKVVEGYLCLSLGKDIIGKYPTASYTGLLVKVEPGQNELVKNLEQHFDWRQLESVIHLTDTDQQLYQNYLPPLIVLYKQYLAAGNNRAVIWKQRIDKIASLTHTTALVNKQIGL
jgi:hypothetical protein